MTSTLRFMMVCVPLFTGLSVLLAGPGESSCSHSLPSRFALLKGEASIQTKACCENNAQTFEKVLPVKVTEGNFEEEVLQAESLVLLDFWAEWCIPCLELEPVLEDLAPEFAGRVKICKINVDENPDLLAEYVPDNILPCLILMREGEVIERRYGTDPEMEPEDFLREWFREHLEPEG